MRGMLLEESFGVDRNWPDGCGDEMRLVNVTLFYCSRDYGHPISQSPLAY